MDVAEIREKRGEIGNCRHEARLSARRVETEQAHKLAVLRVVAHMKAHLAEELTLQELATAGGVARSLLIEIFDETTGSTPHQFLSCLRMQRAKTLLLTSTLSITDICMEVGYSSLGSFSNYFSTMVGASPANFRKFAKDLDSVAFPEQIRLLLARRQDRREKLLHGIVENANGVPGIIFVGTYPRLVAQGQPHSAILMPCAGAFSIAAPPSTGFCAIALLLPFRNPASLMLQHDSNGMMIATERLGSNNCVTKSPVNELHLKLRPVCAVDPAVIAAVPFILR